MLWAVIGLCGAPAYSAEVPNAPQMQLPADVSLPEETWIPARVRRHGRDLEIQADPVAEAQPAPAPNTTKFEAWLARAAGSSKAGQSTDQMMAMTRGED